MSRYPGQHRGQHRGRHRPSTTRRQGRHRAAPATNGPLRRLGIPAGLALAAALGSGIITGVAVATTRHSGVHAAVPSASTTGSPAGPATASALDTTGTASGRAVTVARALPGTTSRELTRAKPTVRLSISAATPTKTPTKSPTAATQPWSCPLAGCGGPVVSGFGARVSPGGIGSTYHLGDDFAIASGTPLHAMHAGKIVSVGWVPGLGIHVTIDYGHGVQSVFGHLSRVQAAPGQSVARGQLVGYTGNTGNSTGPHLHLEIHVNGRPIDPAPWLRARGIY